MRKIYSLLLMVLAFGCNSKKGNFTDTENDSSTSLKNVSDSTNSLVINEATMDGCYMKVTGRDTLFLQLQQTGENVSGSMHFDNYEKDSSKGTVTGKMENGKLVLWYSFNAEGMHSYSQHILKPVKDGLILGNSDVRAGNDTTFIKKLSAVQYPATNKLTRVACQANPIL